MNLGVETPAQTLEDSPREREGPPGKSSSATTTEKKMTSQVPVGITGGYAATSRCVAEDKAFRIMHGAAAAHK